MKTLSALAIAASLALIPATPAVAVQSPPPSLAEHMDDGNDAQWERLQAWLEAWRDAPSTPTTGEPTTSPTPTPSTPPADDTETTGGSGGALEDRTFQSFTSAGQTSEYHLYAEGIDTSQPVGLLMYADGSGGHGFDNPRSSYLIGGANGLAAVAAKHNMILVVPEAPAPGCPSDNCWYDSRNAEAKAQWSSDLMTQVKGQYDIDTDRIVTGGYSSGAQWHRWFLPNHAEDQSVDLAVMIAYGGAPAVRADYSDEYVDDLVLSWDTGTSDSAYTSASYGAIGGYDWYTDAGFETDSHWPRGVGHGRSGEFGGILDREIQEHLTTTE